MKGYHTFFLVDRVYGCVKFGTVEVRLAMRLLLYSVGSFLSHLCLGLKAWVNCSL